MRKSVLFATTVLGTAVLFAGCTRITNKLNRMFGGATPAPVVTATPAPTVAPSMAPSASPKASVKPAATAKPVMKKTTK